MKMREILNIIDPDKMSVETFCDLFWDVTPVGDEDRSEFLAAMYGQDRQDEAEQLDLKKVRAEIDRLNAAALKDRAAAEIEDQGLSSRPS